MQLWLFPYPLFLIFLRLVFTSSTLMRKIFISLLSALLLFPQQIFSQLENWHIVSPLDFETSLSGSFAEMRKNHFHGGLDLRTEGVENKPVYAVDDGYVARIAISRTGYGKVAFINHPNGHTTIYGHLNGFVPKLDSLLKKKQYAEHRYETELILDSAQYPVKKGEQFGISGNTGASGGPHVHFEVRRTSDYTMRNPLLVAGNPYGLKDDRAPKISAIKIYGINGNGVVNEASEKICKVITTQGKVRKLQMGNGLQAWGEIGFAVKANDYMSGVAFSYTPRHLRLYADNRLISDITIDSFLYKDTRACNSFMDYHQWMLTREFFMKSFRDINSPLRFYEAQPSGLLTINEERDYSIRYEVEDDFGNKDSISFVIHGQRKELQTTHIADSLLIKCGENVIFERKDFAMVFPANALYTDVEHRFSCDSSSRYLSDIYSIGSLFDPLHLFCDISIKITHDTVADKSKYYIAKLNSQNLLSGSAGGKYVNGIMVGQTNTFGRFAVTTDVTPPVIAPVHTNQLRQLPYLRFKIYDTQSGIDSYDAYIDGQWVMFEYDAKTQQITYFLDKSRIQQMKNHSLKMVIKDYCGNSTEYTKTIYW